VLLKPVRDRKEENVLVQIVRIDAFIVGCTKLYVHLSILFNLFLSHCYLPPTFTESVIVPFIKIQQEGLLSPTERASAG